MPPLLIDKHLHKSMVTPCKVLGCGFLNLEFTVLELSDRLGFLRGHANVPLSLNPKPLNPKTLNRVASLITKIMMRFFEVPNATVMPGISDCNMFRVEGTSARRFVSQKAFRTPTARHSGLSHSEILYPKTESSWHSVRKCGKVKPKPSFPGGSCYSAYENRRRHTSPRSSSARRSAF